MKRDSSATNIFALAVYSDRHTDKHKFFYQKICVQKILFSSSLVFTHALSLSLFFNTDTHVASFFYFSCVLIFFIQVNAITLDTRMNMTTTMYLYKTVFFQVNDSISFQTPNEKTQRNFNDKTFHLSLFMLFFFIYHKLVYTMKENTFQSN